MPENWADILRPMDDMVVSDELPSIYPLQHMFYSKEQVKEASNLRFYKHLPGRVVELIIPTTPIQTRCKLNAVHFLFTGDDFRMTQEMKNKFNEDGYIILRSVLDNQEMKLLKSALEDESGVLQHKYHHDDGDGFKTRMCLWNHPGCDVTGMLARSDKIAGTMEQLLGGEVYHYHTKLIMKEARTGGQFNWHQDYGYWYNNGCLYPDMGSVMLAIDKADAENGCLQILPGSHKLGRVDHLRVAGQMGADMERVKEVLNVLPLVFVELNAGDALYFHSNVLHRSDQNHSDRRRWALIAAYNRATNNPVRKHHHPFYTPLQKVANSAINECKTISDMTGKDFLHIGQDRYKTVLIDSSQSDDVDNN
ncbi:L-proline trans-4-hydroxylase-like [Glandiceps talaboti]